MSIDPAQLDDLRAISNLPPEKFHTAIEQLRKLEPAPVRPSKVFQVLAASLPEHEEAIDCLVRESLVLLDWMRSEGRTVADIVGSIGETLGDQPDWGPPEIAKWQKVEAAFAEFLELKIVRLVARSVELSYEYANVLLGTRILTDIRPIFNADADAIDGAVVAHTLLVRFQSIEGRHEFTVAMNEEDVKRLAEQCDRALRKGRTARSTMLSAKVPTTISGADDDA